MPRLHYLFAITLFLLLSSCSPKNEQNNFIQPQCLASQSQCNITVSLGNFDILFNVETVLTEQTFNIIVKNNSLNDNLEIKGFLEGKEMYMGKIPLFFNKTKPQIFNAETLLGSCSEAEMVWRMWLYISDKTNREVTDKVFIDFKSYRG